MVLSPPLPLWVGSHASKLIAITRQALAVSAAQINVTRYPDKQVAY